MLLLWVRRVAISWISWATGATGSSGVPLVGCSRRSTGRDTAAGGSGRTGPVVRTPLGLGLGTLRGILAAVLTLTLPTAGIHRALLVGRIRLLVLFKIGMPPGLVGLILPVVVRLGRLRWCARIASLGTLLGPSRGSTGLSRGTRSSRSGGTTGRSLALSANGSGRSCRWRLRSWPALALTRWWLLLVGSLLGRRRIRTAAVASSAVWIGSGGRCRTRCWRR